MLSNITKIKYTTIGERLYKVKDINFESMKLIAVPCELDVTEIPQEELFPLDELRTSFDIRIEN